MEPSMKKQVVPENFDGCPLQAIHPVNPKRYIAYPAGNWDSLKAQIFKLYIKENRTLAYISETLNDNYNISISHRQLRLRLHKWQMHKYQTPPHKFLHLTTTITNEGPSDQSVRGRILHDLDYQDDVHNASEELNQQLLQAFVSPRAEISEFGRTLSEFDDLPTTLVDKFETRSHGGDENDGEFLTPILPDADAISEAKFDDANSAIDTSKDNQVTEMQDDGEINSMKKRSFADSGYKSVPSNADLTSTKIFSATPSPAQYFQESADLQTIYSAGSTVNPCYSRKFILELCKDMRHRLRYSFRATKEVSVPKFHHDHIKALAIQLCEESPLRFSETHREVIFFIYKRHKDIALQLEAVFTLNEEDAGNHEREHDGNMSVHEKMKMWSSRAEQDSPTVSPTDVFEGVQEDEEDPIGQEKLSAYHRLITESVAYDWYLQNVVKEAGLQLNPSQERIREQILADLLSETYSERDPASSYEVIFEVQWNGNMKRNLANRVSQQSSFPLIITGSTDEAQGLSIQEYLEQMWPSSGTILLNTLKLASLNTYCTYSVTLPRDTRLDIESRVDKLIGRMIGSAFSIAECAELITWIGATIFHGPQDPSSSCAQVSSNFLMHSLTLDPLKCVGFCKIDFNLTTQENKNQSSPGIHNFRQDLVGGNTIILGFPIRRRPAGFPGLEVSFDILLQFIQASKHDEVHVLYTLGIIDGPQGKVRLMKHVNNVFLWLMDHSLADCTICCKSLPKDLSVPGKYHLLNYRSLQMGRHILTSCTDISGISPDTPRCSDSILTKATTVKYPKSVSVNSKAGSEFVDSSQKFPQNYNSRSGEPNNQNDDSTCGSQIDAINAASQNNSWEPFKEGLNHLKSSANDFAATSQSSPESGDGEDSLDSDMITTPNCSENTEFLGCGVDENSNFIEIVDQLLAGFRSAAGDQKSSNTDSITSIRAKSRYESIGVQNVQISTHKRKFSSEGDENGDEDGDRQRHKKMKAERDDSSAISMACPLFKWDPIRYSKCCEKLLSSISYVKQHLRRKHTPERYCQTCNSANFPTDDSLQRHINTGKCVYRCRTMVDGISYQQRFTLSRKSKALSSKEEQWYAIWVILLPRERMPNSIYVAADLALEMRQFREYSERHGPAVIRAQMEAHPTWLNTERTLEECHILENLIARGLSLLINGWCAKNTSTSNTASTQDNSGDQSTNSPSTGSLVDSGVGMMSQGASATVPEAWNASPVMIAPALGFVGPVAESRRTQISPLIDDPIATAQPADHQTALSTSFDMIDDGMQSSGHVFDLSYNETLEYTSFDEYGTFEDFSDPSFFH